MRWWRSSGLAGVLAGILLLGPAPGRAEPSSEFPEPPHGPAVGVGAAPVIVVGTAMAIRSVWSEQERQIFSLTTFRVERVERGNPPREITIQTRGGSLPSGLTQVTTHEARFLAGERARVFLEPAGDVYLVVGGEDGKQTAPGSPSAQATCGPGYCLSGLRWRVSAMPVHFRVNPNTSDVSGEDSAIVAGFATWEADAGSYMNWTYDGTTSITTTAFDGTNAVYFKNVNRNYLAVTTYWASGNDLLQFDVEFDDADAWAIGAVSGRFDVQSVAVHEAGHALGLDHVNDPNQVMNPTIPSGTTKRSLGSGDINGVRALYTNDAPRGHVDRFHCREIRGWAFDPDEPDDSIEVHVYIDGVGYNTGPTPLLRSDVNNAFGIAGNHGFDWTPPTRWLDGRSHSVTVYAINIPSWQGSNPSIGTGTIGPCGVPSAPRNLSATGTGPGIIDLAWQPPSSDGNLPLAAYKIFRRPAGGSETLVATVGPSQTTYRDVIVPFDPLATYHYRVRASNEAGDGPFSNEACARPLPEQGPLAC